MRRQLIAFTAAIGVIAVSACAGTSPTESSELPANEVLVELGHTQQLDGTGIYVMFREVTDGRCPINVLCFTAGNAKVALDLSYAGDRERGELNTMSEFGPLEVRYRWLKIEMADLKPYPVYQKQPEHPYRVTLRFSTLPD